MLVLVAASTATACAAGGGEVFAGQLVGTRGSLINEEGFDDRHLLNIGLLNALVRVHVGVVRASVIVHRVLDELEGGQTDRVVGLVVRAGGVANGDHARGDVFDR